MDNKLVKTQEWQAKHEKRTAWNKCKSHVLLIINTYDEFGFVYQKMFKANKAEYAFVNFIKLFSEYFEVAEEQECLTYLFKNKEKLGIKNINKYSRTKLYTLKDKAKIDDLKLLVNNYLLKSSKDLFY